MCYSVVIRYVSATECTGLQLANNSSQRATIRTRTVVRDDKASAWQLVQSTRMKAAASESVALINIFVYEGDCVTRYSTPVWKLR